MINNVVYAENDFLKFEDCDFEDDEIDLNIFIRFMSCLSCICCFIDTKPKRIYEIKKKYVKTSIENLKVEKSQEEIRNEAAIKIQSIIRGKFGKKLALNQWQLVIEKTNDYWLEVIRKRNEDKERLLMLERLRKKFIYEYVNDVIEVSIVCYIQNHAAITIQRFWRNYLTNKKYPRKSKIFKKKKKMLLRYGIDVYRRLWGRSHFEPRGGWPGRAEVIMYDVKSHENKPPVGKSYGLKTYKVHILPRSYKEKEILLTDSGSWIGIPVQIQERNEYLNKKKQIDKVNEKSLSKALKLTTPYLTRNKVLQDSDEGKSATEDLSAKFKQWRRQEQERQQQQQHIFNNSLTQGSTSVSVSTELLDQLSTSTRGFYKPLQSSRSKISTDKMSYPLATLLSDRTQSVQNTKYGISQTLLKKLQRTAGIDAYVKRKKRKEMKMSSWQFMKQRTILSSDLSLTTKKSFYSILFPPKPIIHYKMKYIWLPQPYLSLALQKQVYLHDESVNKNPAYITEIVPPKTNTFKAFVERGGLQTIRNKNVHRPKIDTKSKSNSLKNSLKTNSFPSSLGSLTAQYDQFG